jgi:ferric-dicitrate binding protein FerR (iron transport regulator)
MRDGSLNESDQTRRGGVSMKMKAILLAVLSLLLVYVPASAAAPSAAAKMTTAGMATLNGAAAPALTSVFPGDRIATEQKARTTLSFPGGDAVVIPEMTRVELGEASGRPLVNLESGTLSVLSKGESPVVIMARGARITAVNGSVFDVTMRGNSLRVVARKGMARVETANRAGNVEAGNALMATMAPSSPSPAGAGHLGFTATDWTIVGISAAAATGLGVGLYEVEKGNSASPAVP